MRLFIENFGFIIAIAIWAFVGIFICWKFPLPKELRSGNMWQQAQTYQQYLPGWKGWAIKYFWRMTTLATLAILGAKFLQSIHIIN